MENYTKDVLERHKKLSIIVDHSILKNLFSENRKRHFTLDNIKLPSLDILDLTFSIDYDPHKISHIVLLILCKSIFYFKEFKCCL